MEREGLAVMILAVFNKILRLHCIRLRMTFCMNEADRYFFDYKLNINSALFFQPRIQCIP